MFLGHLRARAHLAREQDGSPRQGQRERRPSAFARSDADVSAERSGESAREREPDPGAVEAAPIADVELMEVPEELSYRALRDADARVLHVEANEVDIGLDQSSTRPFSVNFSAFDKRFKRICFSR